MTSKEELRQIRDITIEIQSLEESLLELETRITRITPILSDMPSGSGADSDKMATGVIHLIEMKKERADSINRLRSHQKKCEKIVLGLTSSIYRIILLDHYFDNKSLQEIADKTSYSYRHICRMHGEALREYETIKRWQDMSYSNVQN